jgi:lipopolysaccharide transport system ATP-binding protein
MWHFFACLQSHGRQSMTKPIIEVADLGKRYRLGVFGVRTLREDVARLVQRLTAREQGEDQTNGYCWAVRNLSFEVQPGETLGFIGGNGAGKSTLLKILARITEPTEGCARIRGRVAALLEVGSGFHSELTGRENIFLNAAILGMTRAETKLRIDDIIEFSGVERYIDTPVKRYSSGMRVRLAFAVAAFLEPDILIADEVLAVGDATFQKKSLGRMKEVAHQGRTVLFVSHDLAAVQNLCDRVIVLRNGRFVTSGPPAEAISHYLQSLQHDGATDTSPFRTPEEGPHLVSFSVSQGPGSVENLLMSGKPAHLVFTIGSATPDMTCALEFYSESGVLVSRTKTEQIPFDNLTGDVQLKCVMEELLLTPGRYRLAFHLWLPGRGQQSIENLITFEVKMGDIGYHRLWSQRGCGYVHLPQTWSCEPCTASAESAGLVSDSVTVA